MNPFDWHILHFLNQFAQRSQFFDYLNAAASTNPLLTSAPLVAIFWWAWFRDNGKNREDRRIIISSIFLCTAAIFIARFLALSLPYRERPLRNPLLQFRVPFAETPTVLIKWSSFPSDHAVFLFCLATSVFFLSRKLGTVVLCYVSLVCCSLVYLGIHYPTDILAGAALGTGIACLTLIKPFRDLLSSRTVLWAEHSPTSFYSCFYLITFLFGTMFDPLRTIAAIAWHASRTLIHR